MYTPLSTTNESPFSVYFSFIDEWGFYGYNEYSHEEGVLMLYKKKVALQDFTSAQLPKNRIESVIDICRTRFTALIGLGLILLLFSMPFIIHLLLSNITIYEINLAHNLGHITEMDARDQLFNAFTFRHIISIPLLLIFGIGLSGVTRLLRQLLFLEPLFFFEDFKHGVKTYGKYNLIILGLFGIINFIFQTLLRLPNAQTNSAFYLSTLIVAFIVLIFFILIGYYSWVQNSLYTLSFKGLLKNSLLFSMRYFFKTVVVLMVFIPWTLLLIPYAFGFILVIIILTIVILPIELLIILAFGYAIMDDNINQKHYPSIYRKGLWTHESN